MGKLSVSTPDACLTCSGFGCGDCGDTGLEAEAIRHGCRTCDHCGARLDASGLVCSGCGASVYV